MATLTTTLNADFVVPAAGTWRLTARGSVFIEVKTAAGDYLKMRGGAVRDEAVEVNNAVAGTTYRIAAVAGTPVIEASQ